MLFCQHTVLINCYATSYCQCHCLLCYHWLFIDSHLPVFLFKIPYFTLNISWSITVHHWLTSICGYTNKLCSHSDISTGTGLNHNMLCLLILIYTHLKYSKNCIVLYITPYLFFWRNSIFQKYINIKSFNQHFQQLLEYKIKLLQSVIAQFNIFNNLVQFKMHRHFSQ